MVESRYLIVTDVFYSLPPVKINWCLVIQSKKQIVDLCQNSDLEEDPNQIFAANTEVSDPVPVLFFFTSQIKPKRPTVGKKSKKGAAWKFTLDLTHPVEDGILDSANFVSIPVVAEPFLVLET